MNLRYLSLCFLMLLMNCSGSVDDIKEAVFTQKEQKAIKAINSILAKGQINGKLRVKKGVRTTAEGNSMEYIINLYDVKVKNDSIPILLEKFALPTSFALFTTIDSLTASQYNVFGLSVSSEGKASTMRFTKKQLQNVNFCLQNALVFLEGIKSKNLELLKKSGKEDLFDSNWSKTTANLDSIDATYGVIQEASISEMSLYKNEDSKERLEVQCNLKRSKTETANIINLLIDTQTFRVVGFDL